MSEQQEQVIIATNEDPVEEVTGDGETTPQENEPETHGSLRVGTTASARFNVLSTVCFIGQLMMLAAEE